MDLKRLVTHFSYKIEPRPDGGFIARPSDPSIPSVEAPTREELQQKIRENIVNSLYADFPQLKSALEEKETQLLFHVENAPQGGFTIHSADPNTQVIPAANSHELEAHVLEKVLNFAGKHLAPELSKALAAQGGAANVKVVINKKTSFRVNAGPRGLSFGESKAASAPTESSVLTQQMPDFKPSTTLADTPITPEETNWKLVGLLIAALALAAAAYFFVHYR
jgi:hypothetical protein